jgi:indole-3-glycerol phosphate synthase/phosphoribosylanthranilate isomerase
MALESIARRTRRDVAERKEQKPLSDFESKLIASDRSLASALRKPGTSFILECKKASPSQGLIRPDFDPGAIAKSYAPFADAVSVLTDAPHFQGCHSFLQQVRSQIAHPVLCKDFIVDRYQIFEARHHGADAVLLMCSLLSQHELVDLHGVAAQLGMDALVEVHDTGELARAIDLGAEIIGINNRDLKTLEVDIRVTEELAPRVPKGVLRVCESGIRDHADVVQLRGEVDAFLVGTSLMRRADLDCAVRELIFGRVKICGLTSDHDAARAHNAGASHGGLVFWPESSRAVTCEQARAVTAGAPLRWIGVFVDAAIDAVAQTASDLALTAVQLHGNEDDDYVTRLRAALPEGCEIWRAKRIGGANSDAIPDAAILGVDRVLLDSYHPDRPGGTGQRFDWELIAGQARKSDVILSGGLSPENIDQADAIGCWGLDLSSGVEAQPGEKDDARLQSLFSALRNGRRSQSLPTS